MSKRTWTGVWPEGHDGGGPERALAGVPIIESMHSPRGRVLQVKAGAFIDAPSTPALIMHPIDVRVLEVALERHVGITDIGVMSEGFRRYLADRIEALASQAGRRIDRMVDGFAERDARPADAATDHADGSSDA